MKLSELPHSFFYSLKLLIKPVHKLENPEAKHIPIIVTLTSIPTRMKTLHITIRSLLMQDALPEKIVLWLNNSYQSKIPFQLKKLCGSRFEIRFSPFTFSHRKLIHSLKAFPNSILITCDDDLIYHPNCLKLLYQEHLKNPEVIIGNRCRQISYNKKGQTNPYLKWPFVTKNFKHTKSLMPVGAFCVLYPPHVLDERVHDIDLLYKLSPKSDDLWFKTMALLNKTLSITSENPPPKPIPIIATQSIALKKINNKQDFKRVQWERITTYFNLNSDL